MNQRLSWWQWKLEYSPWELAAEIGRHLAYLYRHFSQSARLTIRNSHKSKRNSHVVENFIWPINLQYYNLVPEQLWKNINVQGKSNIFLVSNRSLRLKWWSSWLIKYVIRIHPKSISSDISIQIGYTEKFFLTSSFHLT